jgi:hypothetical protein
MLNNIDIASLAAFYAMVSQGMTEQARDSATTDLMTHLAKLAKLAKQVWPNYEGYY